MMSSYDYDAPRPEPGSSWIWKAGTEHEERVCVRQVMWNGEEWWIQTWDDKYGTCWNELDRFWEAVTPIKVGGRVVSRALGFFTVAVILLAGMVFAPHSDAAIVKGEVCLWHDIHYSNGFICRYADLFDTTYKWNLDHGFMNNEASSFSIGGLRRTTSCRITLFDRHAGIGPRLRLAYKIGYADPPFHNPSTGNTEYHARTRGDLRHAYYSNGVQMNDNVSFAKYSCTSVIV